MNEDKFKFLCEAHRTSKSYFDLYIKDCLNPDTLNSTYTPEIIRKILMVQDGIMQELNDIRNIIENNKNGNNTASEQSEKISKSKSK